MGKYSGLFPKKETEMRKIFPDIYTFNTSTCTVIREQFFGHETSTKGFVTSA
jgi:hypothetical protein